MWTIEPADRAGAHLVLSADGREQSHVDLDDPTHLAFDYMRRLGDLLDLAGPAAARLRVVHIGGAGLTLPRYICATRPGSAQIVLEPDQEVTDLVRSEIPLPHRSGIKVRPVSGREGVAALRDRTVDVVVLDAYQDGAVPRELLTVTQATEVARVLDPAGWYVLNLSDRAPFAGVRRSIAAVREVLPHVVVGAEPATLRGRREGNLVVVASAAPLPVERLRGRARTSPAPYRVLDESQTRDSLGGGRPWTEADMDRATRG